MAGRIVMGSYLSLQSQEISLLDDLLEHGGPLAGLDDDGVDLRWLRLEVFLAEDAGLETAAGIVGRIEDGGRFVVERHCSFSVL